MEIRLKDVCSKNLNNINYTFLEEEVTALIGNNSSGKIELLNLLYGLDNLENGTINYGRKKIDIKSTSKKIDEVKKDIFYLSDSYRYMLFNINIKEDIKFYLGKYNEEELHDMLKSFSLDKSILCKNYMELSSSEYKKILLIISLLINPKILILLNPTTYLDYKATQTLIKKIKKLKRLNKIIIISSNNIEFILSVSDKIVVIDNKTIISSGLKYDILSNEKLLNSINMKVPNVLEISNTVKRLKNIKIGYRDDESDLLKDMFRNAR